MPEYLAPGVFIEEIPARLKAIEGVSTSTAGFVGVSERGPLAGFALPFVAGAADPQPVPLSADPTPLLVTSFGEFVRIFGQPLPLPDPNATNFMGWAVKAFFDNGGKRAYIVRVARQNDVTTANNIARSALRLHRGVVLRIGRAAAIGDTTLAFNSLRRVETAGANAALSIRRRSDDQQVATATVNAVDHLTNTVTLTAALALALDPSVHYVVLSAVPPTADGPRFWARHPGAWSASLRLVIQPSERAATTISAAVSDALAPLTNELSVLSSAGIYRGAIIEVTHAAGNRSHHEVEAVRGGTLVLAAALGAVGVTNTSRVRVMEVDIAISDESAPGGSTEVFRNLTWNPRNLPDIRRRHYSTVVNAQSRLCYVQPPGVGGLGGSESADIASQPTTWNGFGVAPRELAPRFAGGGLALAQVITAITAIQAAAVYPPAVASAGAATTAAAAAGTAAAAVGSTSAAARTALLQAQTAATATSTAANAAAAGVQLLSAQGALAAFNADSLVALGSDGATLNDADYVGTNAGPGTRTGVEALADNDEIRIVAVPGRTAASVQLALTAQCERLRYRFAVLDGERDPLGGSVDSILGHRNLYDSSFAAYYAPWVEITVGEDRLLLPPSGFAVGVYARTDNERGVWKAPANETVRTATGLRSYITTGEQEVLNPRGVNCIRRFEGRGIRIWGARTLSSDPEFKYVNVRRFLIFMEASIDRGTQWVVFEPNTPDTWGRVVDSISAFLHTQWRSGALFGRRPEDAFYVRCDESTMTADDVQNGRLICNIGVAIVRPAEFVIFRIEQITGFAQK